MRFHEDRFDVPDELRVANTLLEPDLHDHLATTLAWYRQKFNSDLFGDTLSANHVPLGALRDVITNLVEPWERLRLDFSVTRNEVAGRLYRSYLRLAPHIDDEGRLFPGAELRSRQQEGGAYYTPAPIAELLVRATIRRWLEEHRPARFDEVRVLDPACGSGSFLVAAYRELLRYWEEQRKNSLSEVERSEILVQSVFGIDTDDAAVMLCRVQLLEEAELERHPLPGISANIVVGDSLGEERVGGLLAPSSFDIVVTNPPFASPRMAVLSDALPEAVARFRSLRGTGRNLAYAFVELAADVLRSGGYAGLVVPRALLDGPSSAAARQVVLDGSHVEAIVDFGRIYLFEDAATSVAALVLAEDGDSDSVTIKVHDAFVSRTQVLEAVASLHLGNANQNSDAPFSRLQVPRDILESSGSWAPFALRWRLQLRNQIGVPTTPMGSDGAPAVAIGTQTGRDKSYVIPKTDYTVRDDHLHAHGESVPIEYAPFWARGEDIRPFRLSLSGRRVILPVRNRNAAVDRFIEAQGGVPRSFRPGQLDLLNHPKILVRNLFNEPAAAADVHGDVMPPQGVISAIVPLDEAVDELFLIEGILNSSLYQWLLQGLAQPRAGGFGRLMAHHWHDVPWPELDQEARGSILLAVKDVHQCLDDASAHPDSFGLPDRYWHARRRLDSTVLAALNVGEGLRRIISQELWRFA